MKTLGYGAIGLLVAVAAFFGWRAARPRVNSQATAPSSAQPVIPPAQNPGPPALSAAAVANASASRLGPFSIAGQDYTVELQTRKVRPVSVNESADTVVGMEIRDASGTVQYQRTFPYVEGTDDYFESWSVSAQLLVGTKGSGLLVNYDVYSEPSAPEQEPTGWFQVYGLVNGKFVPFGAPLEVQGGLADQYFHDKSYMAARSLDDQADDVEFKVWTGHCRILYPVRVDWRKGKLSPAQECAKSSGGLSAGCQYKIIPEEKRSSEDITFVRLWPEPDEKSGQPVKTVVKLDSKVELLTALAETTWVGKNTAAPSSNSQGPLPEAGGFGVLADADLWLKVHIDGKEGWMHSEEDFRALGLPEDQ